MSSKSAKPQTPEQLARAEKQRLARTEGAFALADVNKEAIAIRKNMERLRALRLAKEAEDALNAPVVVAKKKAAPKKKVAKKAVSAADSESETVE